MTTQTLTTLIAWKTQKEKNQVINLCWFTLPQFSSPKIYADLSSTKLCKCGGLTNNSFFSFFFWGIYFFSWKLHAWPSLIYLFSKQQKSIVVWLFCCYWKKKAVFSIPIVGWDASKGEIFLFFFMWTQQGQVGQVLKPINNSLRIGHPLVHLLQRSVHTFLLFIYLLKYLFIFL